MAEPIEVVDTIAADEADAPEPMETPPPVAATPTPDPEPETTPDPTPSPTPVADVSEPVMGDPLTLMAGRVHTLEIDATDDISEVTVIEGPEAGQLTVNPDNTLALVLSNTLDTGTTSITYRVDYTDGTSETVTSELEITASAQESGWGMGQDHYMLEVDENDDVIVEAGEEHRKIYISKDEDALSRADIAALEGLDEGAITTKWLLENPEYGGSEDMALEPGVGMDIWEATTGDGNDPSSNWLLLEDGYSYDLGRLIEPGSTGESELNPLHVTSWGEGETAEVTSEVKIFQGVSKNIVFSDLHFSGGLNALGAQNILFDDVTFTDTTVNVQNGSSGITFHNSEFYDIYATELKDGDTEWEAHPYRVQGLFVNKTDGLLIEGVFSDHNGWAPDYDGTADGGQPPSMFSHNFYIQSDVIDLTFRDNISMRGSSYGAALRGGGFVEDNVLIDNNAGLYTNGGDYLDAGPVGNYTIFTNNLITSAGHKEADMIGAVSVGMSDDAQLTTLLDNIITHLADPNNPDEFAEKTSNTWAFGTTNPYYDDTIIYNWIASGATDKNLLTEQNIDGLDTDTLDDTTIQLFTDALLGTSGSTIDDLAEFLRAQEIGEDSVDADMILDFFQTGFGITQDVRTGTQTLRFVPDDLSDGMRWDNRLNWDTDDIPMDGDSVDLGSNWVYFGGTSHIEDLDLGDGGRLFVESGKLSVAGDVSGDGLVRTDDAGQFWMSGHDGTSNLRVVTAGGRFVNEGDIDGSFRLTANDGEAILATDGGSVTLDEGSEIRINGSKADVGFTGEGTGGVATMTMEEGSALTFKANPSGMGRLSEFSSSATDGNGLQSGVNLEDGTLRIILDGQVEAGTELLIDVDEIVGSFDRIQISGLGDSHDALLLLDYENDHLTLDIFADGSGQAFYEELGAQEDTDSAAALWEALTAGHGTYDETLPEIDLYEDNDALLADF
ncbi:MAG: hypothetical protein AAGA15_00140 [Pseudomonadota bacterium]